MKFGDFKIFKFSTVAKKIIRIREYYSRIFKKIKNIPFYIVDNTVDSLKITISRIKKISGFGVSSLLKIFEFADIRKWDLKKFLKYLNIRRYSFFDLKKISFSSYKSLPTYFIVFLIFFGLVYVSIPLFYKYNKADIEKAVCEKNKINCLIRGKVNYSFYPTPRIKIKDLVIKDFYNKNKILATVEQVDVKIAFKNLLNKKYQILKKVELKNAEINFDVKNLKKYGRYFVNEIRYIPTKFSGGKISFYDENNYIASIYEINLNLIFKENSKEALLKGKFLGDSIYINLENEKSENKYLTNLVLKMSNLNFLTKANFVNTTKDEDPINGNILLKKNKQRFVGEFNYKNNEIEISNSKLTNIFLEGELEGKIKILPYFDFNLDLNSKSMNFTKLYSHFLALDESKQKELFKINKKFNGKLNLSSDKIYSSYNLVKSFESRLKFNNGNIIVDQFLINLGKLGAADIAGTVSNDKKFTNFKYESNIFIDNQKKFLNKFGIYNKKNMPSNIFISGNFDLQNIRKSFYEISHESELNNEDINFIEKEFNNLMLRDGYKDLLRFPKFKEFLKLVTVEEIN